MVCVYLVYDICIKLLIRLIKLFHIPMELTIKENVKLGGDLKVIVNNLNDIFKNPH